jgi:NAD(P)-dependent dehydrogenase (short-subunit alcohol dehydrogenase family)
MGRAGAVRFAQEGAHVVVTDIDADAAAGTASIIVEEGGSAESHQLNVMEIDHVTSLFEDVKKSHGVVHVVYNHAGVPGAAGIDMSESEFDFATDVNMKGAFYVASKAMPLLLLAAGKGSLIFTASVSGIVGSPLSPLYSMTKGGIVTLMKSLALFAAPQGVRVNAICPGPILTPMFPTFFGRDKDANIDDLVKGFMTNLPMGRQGLPEEIANAALFLACDESSYVTGVALPVDGGYLAR